LTWLSCASTLPRRPATASISSMKMIEGRFSRARSKSWRIALDHPQQVPAVELELLPRLRGLAEDLEGGGVDDLLDRRRSHPLGAAHELVEREVGGTGRSSSSASKIARRASASGRSIRMCRSKRPGRMTAGEVLGETRPRHASGPSTPGCRTSDDF
jgi:hypothetical protein